MEQDTGRMAGESTGGQDLVSPTRAPCLSNTGSKSLTKQTWRGNGGAIWDCFNSCGSSTVWEGTSREMQVGEGAPALEENNWSRA